MRIEFTQLDRPGVDWNRRELRFGRDADNDVVLDGPGVAAHHVRITHDARGMVLSVEPGAGRVYLNARQVRERALLRAGDNLGIGDFRLRLCRDHADAGPRPVGVASLRVVAGPMSGRARGIGDRLALGNDGPWPLGLVHAPDARVEFVRGKDGIRMSTHGIPEAVFVSVNGLAVHEATLGNGDQITVGPHRFVVEACAIDDGERDAPHDADANAAAAMPGPRREVGWLIATAVLLALVITILFLV